MEPKMPTPLRIENITKLVESKRATDIEKCIKRHEVTAVSIGEGGNAEIYAPEAKEFKKVCLKKIKSQPQILTHDVIAEHNYQARCHKAGVRTPEPILALETDQGQHILMERVYGYTVHEILQKPSFLSKKFDYDTFCQTLEDSVKKMHAIGIYHRDLHSKNIMVDTKTGLPYIIDFGTATEGSGSDLTYEESVSLLNPVTGNYEQKNGYFKDDDKMIVNIRAALRQFRKVKKTLTN